MQNAALPHALCCQHLQPVFGCGRCQDDFSFPSSQAWASLAAGHEEADVIFGGEKCGCPALSSSSWVSLANAQISLAATVKSLQYCRDKCAGQHLPLLCEGGRSSQQLLGSGSTSAALREKRCVFSAALQEADLSKYQLRLPYSCTNSAVLPCWKLLPSPLRACCFAELAVGRPPPWCSASTPGSDLQR